MRSGQQNAAFYANLWSTILRGDIFSDIIVNKKKDGTLYYEEKTITPQRDRNGAITHFISTGKDVTERVLHQERLYHLAHHDALTGLPNRILLLDRLAQAIARARWRNRHVAVLFLDMDRFKIINDTLGHEVGDGLLKDMATRLCECVREGDTVARLGGDEFAIVLNDIASQEDVAQVAQKILEAINRPLHVGGRELFVTTSLGISRFPEDGSDGLTLLKKADVAMYRAKALGKNSYQFYTEEDENKSIKKLSMETSLRRALDRGEFALLYQPQLHLRSCRIVGLEALLRWRNLEHPDVSPVQFIPLLEETGMIVPVGEWVLHAACRQAVEHQQAAEEPLRMSVNISIAQFRQGNFAARVEAILHETGLDPSLLELEVTEGVLIDNIQESGKTLNRIHDLGVTLAIDDFGTGYSSMNYLRRLPFDVLKIDRSFVQDATRSRDDAAIVTAIVTLAHSIGLAVVAEGVERRDQLDFLMKLGCDKIQGNLCSPPIPADTLQQLHECEWVNRFPSGRETGTRL